MKTVFFSNDKSEVEHLVKKLMAQSIPCEVRSGDGDAAASEVELCVQKDEDLPRAFMECVRNSIGFARRKEAAAPQDVRQLLVTTCNGLLAQEL